MPRIIPEAARGHDSRAHIHNKMVRARTSLVRSAALAAVPKLRKSLKFWKTASWHLFCLKGLGSAQIKRTLMATRVMVVNGTSDRLVVLAEVLRQCGFTVVAEVDVQEDWEAQIRTIEPQVIVANVDFPGVQTLTRLCALGQDRYPVVMFTCDDNPQRMRSAIEAGISAYVVRGLSQERVKPIIEIAMTRFAQMRALRQELQQARTTLAERKLIDRAKGILMQQRACSEDEAYHSLRKMAMDQNRRLAEVAQGVIDFAGAFGALPGASSKLK